MAKARSCEACAYFSRGARYCILLGVPVEDAERPPCAARPRRTCDLCPHYLPRTRQCALLEVKVVNPERPPCLYAAEGGAAPQRQVARRPDLNPKLIAAVRAGRPEDVERLLEEGADPNARDERGFTPLHIACAKGSREIVELLLQRGADPNAAGGEGVTPLHVAAYGGHRDVAEELLRWGADPSIRDSGGKTPADVARERGFAELAELIEGWGQADALGLLGRSMREAGSGVLVLKLKFDEKSADAIARLLRGLRDYLLEWRIEGAR